MPPNGIFVLLLILPATALVAAETAPASSPATQPAQIPRLIDPPDLSTQHAEQRETLNETIKTCTNTLDKAAAHLATANWLLLAWNGLE